jgi:homoserine O-acetyltransferase
VYATALSAQVAEHADRHLHSLGDLRLEGGQVLPNAKLACATQGTLDASRANAVLLPSPFTADHHAYDFLIGPGKALDTARYFVITTEMFANGASSSPSNTPAPLDGPRFPPISIRDNVAATHRVVTTVLGVKRLRAVIGFSMGAQQALQWSVSHPDLVDAVVAYCGTAKTYPHGVLRLESAINALTADPAFNGGDYAARPTRGLAAWALHWGTWMYSQEWWRRELFRPAQATPDEVIAGLTKAFSGLDPNNLISQARTWQRHDVGGTPGFGGDHVAALRSIKARVLSMPCDSDLYFPPGDFEYEAQFLRGVELASIRSPWGHMAGAGWNPADASFINDEIRRFLQKHEPSR